MANIDNNDWFNNIINTEFSNVFSDKFLSKKSIIYNRVVKAVETDYKCKLLALNVFKLKNMSDDDAHIYIKYSVERYYRFFITI